MRPNTIVGSACLISVLALVACSPSQPLDAAANEPNQPSLELQAPAQEPPVALTAPAAKAPQPKKAVSKNLAPAAAPKATAPKAPKTTEDAAPAMTATPVMESRDVAVKQQDAESIATTIAGCLVQDSGMFQLKDTDGEHAPKSRSWKSGFIKKGSAKVALVDAGNRLNLASHVGYRVSVSGTLADREMQARAVRGGTERCD